MTELKEAKPAIKAEKKEAKPKPAPKAKVALTLAEMNKSARQIRSRIIAKD